MGMSKLVTGGANEYIYMPMSFAWRKMGVTAALIASFITFVISGIWHGPKMTYVVWGALHGLAIAWDVATTSTRSKIKKIVPATPYKVVSILLTFAFICLTLVIFNAKSLAAAGDMYSMVFTKMNWAIAADWFPVYWREFIIFAIALLVHYLPLRFKDFSIQQYTSLHWSFKTLVAALVIVFVYQFYSAETQPFIYLQF